MTTSKERLFSGTFSAPRNLQQYVSSQCLVIESETCISFQNYNVTVVLNSTELGVVLKWAVAWRLKPHLNHFPLASRISFHWWAFEHIRFTGRVSEWFESKLQSVTKWIQGAVEGPFYSLPFSVCFHGSVLEPNGVNLLSLAPFVPHSDCSLNVSALLVSVRLYKEGELMKQTRSPWGGGGGLARWNLGNGSNVAYASVVSWGSGSRDLECQVAVSRTTALQLSILKCLKMSDILPFQKACCVYTSLLLKSSLVDIRVVEQDGRNRGGPGAQWHLGKCLRFFQMPTALWGLGILPSSFSPSYFGKCDDTTLAHEYLLCFW